MATPTTLLITGAVLILSDVLDQHYFLSSDWEMFMRVRKFRRQILDRDKKQHTFADFWEEKVAQNSQRILFCYQGISLTFLNVDNAANRFANWFLANNLSSEDIVALFFENRPHFVFILLALAKLGIQAALINTSVKGQLFLQFLQDCKATSLVFGDECSAVVQGVHTELKAKGLRLFACGQSLPLPPFRPPMTQSMMNEIKKASNPDNLNLAISQKKDADWLASVAVIETTLWRSSSDPISRSIRSSININSKCCSLCTSGSSGLPKIMSLSHRWMLSMAMSFSSLYDIKEDDIIYAPLPMWHFSGLIAIGSAIHRGACLVISPKFSVSKFWEDVREYKCTVIQYVGEQCRYLLRSPPSVFDQAHSVRFAFGTGLKPDIFRTFQQRFNISEIGEFYFHAEAAIALLNLVKMNGKGAGAIGHLGPILRLFDQTVLVQYDSKTRSPKRNAKGLCIRCQPGQVGELLGPLLLGPVSGLSSSATESDRYIRNVLRQGDVYIRTGDLLYTDQDGFFYLYDKIRGFKWKSEHVSTTQVADVLLRFTGCEEAIAYGVELTGNDGQAVMAGIVLSPGSEFHTRAFAEYVSSRLLPHAIPLFIRLLPSLALTDAFKLRKVELENDGIDLSRISDPVYMFNRQQNDYKLLDSTVYKELLTGKAKL